MRRAGSDLQWGGRPWPPCRRKPAQIYRAIGVAGFQPAGGQGRPPHFFIQYFHQNPTTPAKAGVHRAARQLHQAWIPAFAGMTAEYAVQPRDNEDSGSCSRVVAHSP